MGKAAIGILLLLLQVLTPIFAAENPVTSNQDWELIRDREDIQVYSRKVPGSPLPGWVINMLLVDMSFETMKSFREAAALPKYEQASVSFVEEPI